MHIFGFPHSSQIPYSLCVLKVSVWPTGQTKQIWNLGLDKSEHKACDSGHHPLFLETSYFHYWHKINITLLQIGFSGVIHVKHLAQHSAHDKCLINLVSIIFFMRCYFKAHSHTRHLTIINIKTGNKIRNNVSSISQAYYTKTRPNQHRKK